MTTYVTFGPSGYNWTCSGCHGNRCYYVENHSLRPNSFCSYLTYCCCERSPALAVSDNLRELDLRTSKKMNLIVSSLQPSLLTDDTIVSNLLRDELQVNVTVAKCTWLGKVTAGSTLPGLFLASLSSDQDVLEVLRQAKNLWKSTDQYMKDHVYLNAVLTREQQTYENNLREELRWRRRAGEQVFIRDGRSRRAKRLSWFFVGRAIGCCRFYNYSDILVTSWQYIIYGLS